MSQSSVPLAASSSAETFFVIVGISLVVLAVATAFVGMTREDFPSRGALRGLIGLIALLVLATGAAAVVTARDEPETLRPENEKAAEVATVDEAKEEAASGADNVQPESTATGRQLFVDSGCGDCHTLADADTGGQVGPVLDEVLPGQSPKEIRTSIVDPGASTAKGFPEGVMPATFGDELSEAEIDALVSYLESAAGNG